MKRIFLKITLLMFFLFPVSLVAQNFTLTVQNQTIVGSDFKFDIYIQVTSGDIHLADCDFRLDFNEGNFSSPSISFIKDNNLTNYTTSPSFLSGGTIISINVTTSIGYSGAHIVSSTAPGSKVGTVTITNILNANGTAGLTWRHTEASLNTIVSKYEANDNKTGISGNGTYTNPNDAPLPVELSSFTASANQNTVDLKWQTKTETNNYGFEVERKRGSSGLGEGSWEKIGFMQGRGNSNSPFNYSFIDDNPIGGNKFFYRLKQIDNSGRFEYSKEVEVDVLPKNFNLFQNFPNPFNPETTIKFALPKTAKVSLIVYNLVGEKVATLLDESKDAGFYDVQFNSDNLSSGVYIYRLTAENFVQTKKMTLIR